MKSPKYIHFVSHYAAPYKGNFIPSLETLEQSLYDYSVIYIFPRKAENQSWMTEFIQNHTVRFTDDDVSSFMTVQQLVGIFTEFPPHLIHTHFDGYDVSVVKAAKSFDCNVVWHMHNWLSFMPNIIKRAYQYWCFFRHYGLAAKRNVYLISVCEEMRRFASKFGFPSKQTITIPNGIDISRFELPAPRPTKLKPFVFLAFGGRNSSKRIDLICEAVKWLPSELPFEVQITQGTDTEQVINRGGCITTYRKSSSYSRKKTSRNYIQMRIASFPPPFTKPSLTLLPKHHSAGVQLFSRISLAQSGTGKAPQPGCSPLRMCRLWQTA